MRRYGKKVELEALLSRGIEYFCRVYLPSKLVRREYYE